MSVVIETTLGDITVDLFVDERPQTCLNFLKLCKVKYYNLNLFHSVNANFCAQTGDPTGAGDGGESIHGFLKGPEFRFYQGEVQPKIKHDRTGLISMVSHGQGMLGSQFVITLSPDLGSLDGEHCVFGEVVEGAEVLLKLNEAITDEQHRPYQDIRITHTVVLDDPFPDPSGLGEPPASPLPPSVKDIAFSRIPADEPLKDSCTQEELDEMVQAREAAARATILEMVGDLPDADVAPPENVLFVCKLNPVTTDHDLSIIFSRFGKVKSCEVIRDAVSGDSLQYAFVEFEDQKSCEEAYFKMDNVLIDDRRIHVDFSQSVAKWRGKGKGVEMLGPAPHGGWGNKSRGMKKSGGGGRGHWNDRPRHEQPNPARHDRHHAPVNKIKTEEDDGTSQMKNGSRKSAPLVRNKIFVKKEVERKRKKRSPSSSSSDSSDTTSSSDSSDSEPRKKSRRRTEKVLVVVKTPRGKKHRKKRKVRSKTKKYETDSEEEPVKKRKKKLRQRSRSRGSSSEETYKVKKKKRRASSSEDDLKRKKKRRKQSEASSDDSSDDEIKKKISKKNKKRRNDDDSSDEDRKRSKRTKTKIVKNSVSKKRKHARSESESSSSSN